MSEQVQSSLQASRGAVASGQEIEQVISQLGSTKKQEFISRFAALDTDSSGDLTRNEYAASGLAWAGVAYDSAAELVSKKGVNITLSDFVAARALQARGAQNSGLQDAKNSAGLGQAARAGALGQQLAQYLTNREIATYDAASQRDRDGNVIPIQAVKAKIYNEAVAQGFSPDIARALVADVMVENPTGRGNDDPPGGKFGDGTPKMGTPSQECGPLNIGKGIYQGLAGAVGVPWDESAAIDTGARGLAYGVEVLGKAYQQNGFEKTQILLRGGTEGLEDFNNGFRNGDRHEIQDWLPFKANMIYGYTDNPGLREGTLRHSQGFQAT